MAKRVIVASFRADTKHFNASMRKAEQALRGLGFSAVKAGPTFSMLQKRMRGSEVQARRTTNAYTRLSRSLARVNAGLLGTGGLIYLVTRRFTQGVREATAFDRMVTKASKTSRTFGDALDTMRQSLEYAGIQAGFARDKLGGIAGTAGQIGIKGSRAIAVFSEQIAKLSRTSNLSTDEAAAYTARILQLTDTDVLGGVKTLTAAITHLGNNSNATERQIAEVAVKLAPLGRAFKISAVDVAALGASMASAGVAAQAGATAFLRLFQYFTQFKADNAVAQLSLIARVAKKSVTEVKDLISTDLASLAADFLGGLGELGPGAQGQVLERIGFTALRERKVFLAQANQLPREKLDLARSQIGSPTATENEFAIQLAARSGRIAVATNKLNTAFGRVGDALIDRFLPSLEAAAGFMDRFTRYTSGSDSNFEAGLRGARSGEPQALTMTNLLAAATRPARRALGLVEEGAAQHADDPFVQRLLSASAGRQLQPGERSAIEQLGVINKELARVRMEGREFFLEGLAELKAAGKDTPEHITELNRQQSLQYDVDARRLEQRRRDLRFGTYNKDGKLIEEGLRHLAARATLESTNIGFGGDRAAAMSLLNLADREKNPNRVVTADPGVAGLFSPHGSARDLATALLGSTLHRQGRPREEINFQMSLRKILDDMASTREALRGSDDPQVERAEMERLRQKKRDLVEQNKLDRENAAKELSEKQRAAQMRANLDDHFYETALEEQKMYEDGASAAQRAFFQRQAQINEDQITTLFLPDDSAMRKARQANIDLRQQELEADIAANKALLEMKARNDAQLLEQAHRRAAHEQVVLTMMRNGASAEVIEYERKKFEIEDEARRLNYEMTKATTAAQKALLDAAIAKNKQAAEQLKVPPHPDQAEIDKISGGIIDPIVDAILGEGRDRLNDAFDNIMKNLAAHILQEHIMKPLKDALGDLLRAVFSSARQGTLNPLGTLFGFASGGMAVKGGLAMVGERGPELVNLPTGSMVYPHGKMAAAGGGAVVNVNYTIYSEDDVAMERVIQRNMPRIREDVSQALTTQAQGNTPFGRAIRR